MHTTAHVISKLLFLLAFLVAAPARADARADAPPSRRAPAALRTPAPLRLPPPPPADRSVSVGRPNDGRLLHGMRVPESDALRILRDVRSRDTAWGSTQLVRLLVDAADRLHATWPDTTLYLGNLGHRDGGRIRWSRSHQNGRDADLSFILVDAHGRTVEPTFLVHVDPDLRVRENPAWRFCPARNWSLVEALLASQEATIDWIFVSNPLRHALLLHAVATGVPAETIHRAAALLRQPGDSLPHDDHFHVRVTCDDVDRYFACTSYGPIRPEAPWDHSAFEEHLEDVLHCAAYAPDDVATSCLNHLESLQTRESSHVLAGALPDFISQPDRRVRLVALLEREATAAAAPPLLQHLTQERDAALRARIGRLAWRVATPDDACDALRSSVDDTLIDVAIGSLDRPCAREALLELARRRTPGDPVATRIADALAASLWRPAPPPDAVAAWLASVADEGLPLLPARAAIASAGLLDDPADLVTIYTTLPEEQRPLVDAALAEHFHGQRPSSRDPLPARARFWTLRLEESRRRAEWETALEARDALSAR